MVGARKGSDSRDWEGQKVLTLMGAVVVKCDDQETCALSDAQGVDADGDGKT